MGKKKSTEAKRTKKEKEKEAITKDSKDEIDDIFASATAKQKESVDGDSMGSEKAKKSTPPPDHDSFSDIRGTKRKKRALTEDGLPIYTAKEMGMGRGGETDKCPFDCECCF